jgi:hypothetical protein
MADGAFSSPQLSPPSRCRGTDTEPLPPGRVTLVTAPTTPKEIAARQAPVLQPRLLGDDPIALVCGHLSLIPRLLLKLLPPELGVPLANFTIILLYQILLSTTSNLLVMLASLSLPTVWTVGRDSEKAVELEPPAIAWMGSYHRFSRGAGRSSLYGNRRVG